MESSRVYKCEREQIPEAVDFVRDILVREKVESKECTRALLKLENILEKVIESSDREKNEFTVHVGKHLPQIRIFISYKGREFTIQDIIPDLGTDSLDEETAAILKKRMLPILSNSVKITKRHNTNQIQINVCGKKMNRLVLNIVCVLLGILTGLIFKEFVPNNIATFFANEILGTIITIFFNLLKMILAPLVFFAIIMGISGYEDTHELGKIGIRTMVYFVTFSVMGLIIALLIYKIFPSGSPQMMQNLTMDGGKVSTTVSAWDSFKNLLISIFPSNLIGAFVNNEILAVIFLAILGGVCTVKMQSEYSKPLIKGVSVLNEFMCNIATVIVRPIPVIIFASMTKMVIGAEISSLMLLLKLYLSFAVGVIIMLLVYCIVLAINGISPLEFFKGFAPAFITAVTLSSSNATIPVSIRCCTQNLKIPSMITYFVIPLGATINMNGSCIWLTLVCLFTAEVFGVELTFGMLLSVMGMILLLSMAAPGVPGGLIIMLASILPLMGIPSEAAELTICLSAFVGMLLVPANCTGDAVTAMLIHKSRERKNHEG